MTRKPTRPIHSIEPKKPELWRCWCGRRFRGDVRIEGHLDRSGHGVATAVRKEARP